jgi:hypothetical protein
MFQSSDPAAFLHHDQVAGDHFRDELWKSDGVLPAKFLERIAWIAEKEIDLRRTEIARIDLDEGPAALFVEPALLDSGAFPADADAGFGEGAFDEFAHRVGFPGRQDIIVPRLSTNLPALQQGAVPVMFAPLDARSMTCG